MKNNPLDYTLSIFEKVGLKSIAPHLFQWYSDLVLLPFTDDLAVDLEETCIIAGNFETNIVDNEKRFSPLKNPSILSVIGRGREGIYSRDLYVFCNISQRIYIQLSGLGEKEGITIINSEIVYPIFNAIVRNATSTIFMDFYRSGGMKLTEDFTRRHLIEPILHRSGYQFVTECSTRTKRRYDYAVIIDGEMVIIEVKRWGKPLPPYHHQLQTYLSESGFHHGILTDGNHWTLLAPTGSTIDHILLYWSPISPRPYHRHSPSI